MALFNEIPPSKTFSSHQVKKICQLYDDCISDHYRIKKLDVYNHTFYGNALQTLRETVGGRVRFSLAELTSKLPFVCTRIRRP
jgi:hypothetical protein